MVNFIKRDKNDIFSRPILGFLFKNQKFLLLLKIVFSMLFVYALYFGFTHTNKENIFTTALFWGVFWPLFIVITLPTFGRIFCGVCPHGFIGKYITKFGLKKTMPKWMQNRFIGVLLLVFGWWGTYYMFPELFKTSLNTAIFFTVITIIAFIFYFIYKDMSYCKYICPIGTMTRAYSKLSFTWLGTYKKACNECKTFECATVCPYNLKPFTFDNKNSMTDCTLCMDCSNACEAISFKFKKPSFSLFLKLRPLKAEIWAFILIFASIPISMAFHHGIGRSSVANDMIWAKTAEFLKKYITFSSIDSVGLFAFIYALIFTILAAVIGMFIASKILKKDFNSVFYNLGYSYAPLFIFSAAGHALELFFTKGYEHVVEGFAYGFGFFLNVAPLASKGDGWLHIFGLFKWIGIIWSFTILYKRINLLHANKIRKIIAFPFAASLIIFLIGVNTYTGYIFKTYSKTSSGYGGYGNSAKYSQKNEFANIPIFKEPSAEDIIYFTDTNPITKKESHRGGYYGRLPIKKVWPVFKDDTGKENCLKKINANLYLLDANLTTKNILESKEKGCKSVSFSMPDNGYYNLFYVDKKIQNQTLYIQTAKYEIKRFDHSADAVYDEQKMAAYTIKEAPFDILRLREDDETFFHSLYSGKRLRAQVLLDKKPLEGANVTLSTKTGWSKSIKTDKEGIATFVLIQDYFLEWDKFDKRYKNEFLLHASYMEKGKENFSENRYNEIKYSATYPSYYYPDISQYSSYAYGLLTAIITILISGLVIFLYRLRRQKPFKEVSFDEKD